MGLVHFQGESVDAETLTERGGRAASSLARRGVAGDDVIVLMLENSPQFCEALSCVRSLQATRVLLPWPLPAQTMTQVLVQVRATVIIVDASLLKLAAAAIAATRSLTVVVVGAATEARETIGNLEGQWLHWNDLIAEAFVPRIYTGPGANTTVTLTSGSTGIPKVVRRSDSRRWSHWYRFSNRGRPTILSSIVTAPLFNSGQFGVFSQTWYQRADIVMLQAFDPEVFLALVETHRINHAYVIPAMFVQLLKLPNGVRLRYDVSSLQYVVHTGGPCPAHVKAQMIGWWGPVIWEAYGCSETSLIAECSTAEWLARPRTVGKPTVPVVILDGGGQPTLAGEIGRIHAEMDSLPKVTVDGRDPPSTCLGGKQWLATGDSGWVDDDGYLYVVCRNDEQINIGGAKVYPIEVEDILLRHPDVVDCVACRVSDVDLGSTVGALVQVNGSSAVSEAQLREFVAHHLPRSKAPSRIHLVTNALRPATGKVNREHIQQLLQRL